MSGVRDSQWYVLKRCLQIIVTLLHEPATKETLLNISAGEDKERLSTLALNRRLENDLKRLRDVLGCEIAFDREQKCYTIMSIDIPLIDLSPLALQGLAFLQTSFQNNRSPMWSAVQQLIDEIVIKLPKTRQSELRRWGRKLLLDLSPKDDDEIDDSVWEVVERACYHRQLLEFDYYSPSHDDGKPRRNQVEPYEIKFDTQRGHYYLYAFRLLVKGPKGIWNKQEFLDYRLGRITKPLILPKHFSPRNRKANHKLVYELTPQIARFGVTRLFPNCEVISRDDGSAEVHAYVDNLFMSLRELLYYGPGCRVIGDEEAVKQMRELVYDTWSRYE